MRWLPAMKMPLCSLTFRALWTLPCNELGLVRIVFIFFLIQSLSSKCDWLYTLWTDSFPALVHSISSQANTGSVGTVYGALYLNESMTSLTAVVVNQSAFADTFGEGGVTTFTNSPFIWFLLLLQMYANAEVFIFHLYFLFALWF